jgi:hypothetical protein
MRDLNKVSDKWALLVLYERWCATLPDVSGLGVEEGCHAFYDAHGGHCAMCWRTHALVLDHDHRTGLVRGLLCRRCNVMMSSDVAHLPLSVFRSAARARYMQRPLARQPEGPVARTGRRPVQEQRRFESRPLSRSPATVAVGRSLHLA